MKKQVFTILSALSVATLGAQIASPSWTILQSPQFPIPIAGHNFMDAVNPNVAWVKGYDGQAPGLNYDFVSKTNNAGATWTSGSVFPDTNTYSIANLEGLDANTAWVTAYNKQTGGSGVLYRTTNAGASWSNMTAPGMYTATTAFGNWIAFLSSSVAVVNGDPIGNPAEFELWRTTDGGTTFSLIPGANIPNPQSNEYAIVDMYATYGPNHIWFGTNQGRVYRSTDAGVTWSVSSVTGASTPTSSVIEIDFATPTNGLCYMAVGGAAVLYNTFDGGVTWNAIPQGTMNTLPNNYGANEMQPVPGTPYFVSAGNGNGTTAFGGLSYSMDNGLTWIDWGSVSIGYVTLDFSDRWTGWAGSFTNFPDNSWPGIFKYSGNTFNAMFSLPSQLCLTGPNATATPVNNSASPDGALTFSWSSNPVGAQFSSATASVPVVTFTNAGTYTITLVATDPDGPSTFTQVVQVASCAPPSAAFTITNSACNNSSVTLTNNSTGSPAPSVTITAQPQVTVHAPATGNQYTLGFGAPGIYTVNMNVSNISGTSAETHTIMINDCRPTVNFTFGGDTACRNDTVFTSYNLTGEVSSHSYTISPTLGVASTVNIPGTYTNVPNKRILFSNNPLTFSLTTYTVTLRVTNPYGFNEFTRVLHVFPTPTIAVSGNDTICNGDELILTGSGADSFTWSAGGTDITGNPVTVSPTVTTVYNVIGANPTGCSDGASMSVTVEECVGVFEHAQLPAAVYPNPSNGVFNVAIAGNPEFSYVVTDISGRVVVAGESAGDISVDLSDLPAGMYMLRLNADDRTAAFKLFKD